MIRDFNALNQGPYDVLVVGGGIYGAWTALEAALRGLKVAVIDKGDWACGTSTASTKLIHGGLRYLENLRLDLVHSALEERRQLTVMAPHLVAPLRFFIPTYQADRVGPLKLRTGLWLYDRMAGKGQPVAGHRRVNREEALAQFPFLDPLGISGGYSYGDCQTDDGRLVLNVIAGAMRAGAAAVNYTKAVSLLTRGKRVIGARVQDLVSGAVAEVTAGVVVNAAGPWAALVDSSGLSGCVRYSKGVHLIMPPLPTRDALLLMSGGDNRIFFIVPWYGKSLVGTTDSEFNAHPDRVRVEDEDIDYLLTEAGRHLNGIAWNRDSVIGAFAGLRTLQNEPGRELSQVTREWAIIESRPGLLVSVGGKFTTARLDASRVVQRCQQLLQRTDMGSTPTAAGSLPSNPRGDYRTWRRAAMEQALKAGFDQETSRYMTTRFGAESNRICMLAEQQPGLAQRIHPDLAFSWAEVVYSLRHEMVVHLEDLLRRRIPLTILSRPDHAIAEHAAELAAAELGWGRMDASAEVKHLLNHWWRPEEQAREADGSHQIEHRTSNIE